MVHQALADAGEARQALEDAGVPIVGTSPSAIHLAEDRGAFGQVLARAGLIAPKHGTAYSSDEALAVAREIGYSVADILAKALFALVVFRIARLKSAYDDPEYALENDSTTIMLIEEVDGKRPTGVANPDTHRRGEAARKAGATS